MDRLRAMPDGKVGSDVWGTADVQGRFVDNGIEDDKFSFWGGNILQAGDGSYHLFVCGWPENSPKGHMYWPNSTLYHATSSSLHGPFTIADTIGKGHNPEAFRLKDGRIVVYVIDGYYISDSVDGPWKYDKFKFEPRDRKIIEGLSNLTFAKREDGSYLMVCRGGGVWISRTGISEYNQITDKRVYPDVKGEFEDPVVWRDSIQYHLIVNDWLGRIAFYERSKDGINWVVEHGEAYQPGVSFHKDRYVEGWFKYERPKVFQDSFGRAEQINFAVIDTIKWNDLPNDTHSSKNICIPLNKGLNISVLNKRKITSKTKRIKLRIHAEDDFNPAKEIDVPSLRFGSYNEVNFGKGGIPLKSRIEGNDLIVTFSGENTGITKEEFAPKLLGKYKDGQVLFGYAKLPHVDYHPAIISARKPVVDKAKSELIVELQNFGTSASNPGNVKIFSDNSVVGEIKVGVIKPYEKKNLRISIKALSEETIASYKVVFIDKNGNESDIYSHQNK